MECGKLFRIVESTLVLEGDFVLPHCFYGDVFQGLRKSWWNADFDCWENFRFPNTAKHQFRSLFMRQVLKICLVSGMLLGGYAHLTKRYQMPFPLKFLNEYGVFNIFHNALVRVVNSVRLMKTNSTLFRGLRVLRTLPSSCFARPCLIRFPCQLFSLSFSTGMTLVGGFSYM